MENYNNYYSSNRIQKNGFDFQRINIPMLIATAAVGVITWLIGLVVYKALVDKVSRPLLMAIEFGLLTLPLVLTVHLFSRFNNTFEDVPFDFLDGTWQMLLLVLAMSVVVFLMAMFLQFIYGLDGKEKEYKPTSYVFVIDDSGSMQNNDPNGERYAAINSVLEGMPKDFPFMVYGFSQGISIQREMAPISEGVPELVGNNSGGTEIKGALSIVLSDYRNKVWEGGASPRVILLTDGYATDILFSSLINGVLKKYASEGISISTVGLGEVDTKLMEKIAEKTGGVFIDVSDANELSKAMGEAASKAVGTDRDLLSNRNMPKLNTLHGIMRVVFIVIIGMMIGMACYLAYGSEESFKIILITSAIKSLIGALLEEIGICVIGIPMGIMWLPLWVLIATLICYKPERLPGVNIPIYQYSNMGY